MLIFWRDSKSILCTIVFLMYISIIQHISILQPWTLFSFAFYFLTYIKFLILTCMIRLKICDSVLLSERDCSVHCIKTQQWICLLWYWWRYWFSFQGENLWLYSIYFQLIVIIFLLFLSNHFSVVHACQFRKLPLFGIIILKVKYNWQFVSSTVVVQDIWAMKCHVWSIKLVTVEVIPNLSATICETDEVEMWKINNHLFLAKNFRSTGAKDCTPRMYAKRFTGNPPCANLWRRASLKS